jgi:hypothetical protein
MSVARLFSTFSLLVLALTGCGAGDSDPTGPSGGGPGGSGGGTKSVAGTYDLVSLDGHPLPAMLGSPLVEPEYTIRAEIHVGYIQLNPDSTFLYEVVGAVVATGVPYEQDLVYQKAGIYQIGENAITLTNGDGSNSGSTHTFSNGRITVVSTYPGLDGSDVSATMVFEKQ